MFSRVHQWTCVVLSILGGRGFNSSIVIVLLRYPPSSWYGLVQLDVSMELSISSSYSIFWCIIVHHGLFIFGASLIISFISGFVYWFFSLFFLSLAKSLPILLNFLKNQLLVLFTVIFLFSVLFISSVISFYFCPANSGLTLFFF